MKNRGLNAETKSIINKVMKNFMQLHAEELGADVPPQGEPPTPSTTPSTTPTNTVHFEDLVKKAREEEKAKLYPKITKLEAKIKELVDKHNTALLTVGQKDEEIRVLKSDLESAKKEGGVVESEEIIRLKKELKTLQDSTVDVEAIKKQVSDEYEIKLYRMEKLQTVGDKVIPELVMGSTKEEIDASLEASVTRYNSIVGNVQSNDPTPKPNTKVPTGLPVNGFSVNNVSPEDIANMTPKEWAEYRTKIGLK